MKMKARNKLFPAVAMLLVSSLVLGTATFAWFTMSKEVKLNGVNVTATAPESLEISLGQAGQTTLTPPRADVTGDPDWAHVVTYTNTYEATGKLSPASSITGFATSFYSTEYAKKDGQIESGKAFAEANTAAGQKFVGGTQTATPGSYIDVPVWIRTRGTENAFLTMGVEITAADGKALKDAARIAILNEAGTAPALATQPKANAGNTNFEDNPAGTATPTIWKGAGAAYFKGNEAVSGLTDKSFTEITSFIAADTKMLKVPASATDGTPGTAQKFLVRIWVEGQDTDCIDVNAAAVFNVNLTFTKATPV